MMLLSKSQKKKIEYLEVESQCQSPKMSPYNIERIMDRESWSKMFLSSKLGQKCYSIKRKILLTSKISVCINLLHSKLILCKWIRNLKTHIIKTNMQQKNTSHTKKSTLTLLKKSKHINCFKTHLKVRSWDMINLYKDFSHSCKRMSILVRWKL